MSDAAFRFEIDWGTASTANNNVTADVLVRDGFYVDRGVDLGLSPLTEMLPGSAEYTLDNSTYKYHPESTGSPLTGKVVPGRPASVWAVSPSTGYVFKGRTGRFDYTQSPDAQATSVTVNGGLADVAKATITTSAYTGVTVGTAIGHVLDAAGWPAGRRQLDQGGTVIPLWFADDENAGDALRRLVEAEGPGAALFESADGDIVFHDRHRQFTQAASKTSQATWRNGNGSHPWYQIPATYDAGWDYIVNDVRIRPLIYTLSAPKRLWFTGGQRVTLTSGQSHDFSMVFENPAIPATPTVSTGLYATKEAAWNPDNLTDADILIEVTGASSTDLTSAYSASAGQQVTLTVTNASTGAMIVGKVRIQGQEYEEADVEEVTAQSTASQDKYGVRTVSLSGAWMDALTAQDLATVMVNDYAEPTPRMSIPITNLSTVEWNQQIGREISDRVTVVDTRSGMNRDFCVRRISHNVEDGGKFVRATFDVVGFPATPLVGSTEVFILNSTSQGILDTNKLGY